MDRQSNGHAALRVALVVGDTVGHTYPALAVADALRALNANTDVLFLGTADSAAVSILQRAGQRFEPIPGSPIRRAGPVGLARAAWRTLQSVGVTRRSLTRHQRQFVMGFGGFASGGVILAARTLGVPTAIFEANVEFGLANRWLRPWVDRIFHGLDTSSSSSVGVPVRSSVVALRNLARHAPAGRLRLLVVSGSRGDQFFAERLPDVLRALSTRGVAVEVRQQASAPEVLRERYHALGVQATVEAFVGDIAGAYAWADVAVARGGASTLAELAIAGLPALVVPLASASADHQTANARVWHNAGAGLAMHERDWTIDAAVDWLQAMATDAPRWRACVAAARRLARPDAAAHIAAACEPLVQVAS